MLNRLALVSTVAMATTLAIGPIAYAQTAPAQTAPATQNAAPAKAATAPATQGADARKLIGRNIQNAQNETVGEINSVHIDAAGKIDSVIVGVGGFLNMGEREVALRWSDLQVMQNGDKVVVNMTKDQLKALPEYKYREASYRGTVFSDTAPARMNATAPAAGGTAQPAPAARPVAGQTTGSTPVASTAAVSGNTLIGAAVRNMQDEKIGTVDDLVVGADGKINAAVVSVGGFLGMGTRYVTLDWSALTVARDGNTIVVKTNATKDSLKNMPEYKYQRITG